MTRRPDSRSAVEFRLSDPSASRAVLIEAHEFTRGADGGGNSKRYLAARPTVEAGCRRLAELLRDPAVWGLPKNNCHVASQPTRDRLLEAVHDAAAAATDTLVVYYAGHGLLYPFSNGLHLAVPETTKDRSFTAVKYDDLRGILLGATQVRRKVVILDCCFSGTALGETLSAEDDATRLADVEGTSVLAASPAGHYALAVPGEKYPAFTGELVALLGSGVPGGPELLTMADIFDHVDRSLMQKNRPRPQQLNRERGAHICIARNQAPPPPPQPTGTQGEHADRSIRRRWTALGAALAVALSVGLLLWLLPDHGRSDGASDEQTSGQPTVLAGITCGKAHDVFDNGAGETVGEVSVKVVHDAACKGDFDAMQVAMDRNGFDGTGFSAAHPDEVVSAWKKRKGKDRTSFLQSLVTLLERDPEVSQGGLTFSDGVHMALWERGAGTMPDTQLRWSGYFDCSEAPDSEHPACS